MCISVFRSQRTFKYKVFHSKCLALFSIDTYKTNPREQNDHTTYVCAFVIRPEKKSIFTKQCVGQIYDALQSQCSKRSSEDKHILRGCKITLR